MKGFYNRYMGKFNKETKVTEVFDDANIVSKKAIVVSIIFLIVVIIILRLLTVYPEFNKFFTVNEVAFQLYANAVLSVITSVVAAFIFAYIFTRRENKKLRKIQTLANNDYLIELLQSVDRFRGAYVEDYIANVRLCKHPSNQLISVKIHFEYKKYPISSPILITIYRITDEPNIADLQQIVQERAFKEYVWQQDERSFPIVLEPDREYLVDNVWVGKSQCLVDMIRKENEITASCIVPSDVDISIPQPIEYVVTLPFETESVLSLTHDFPTFNSTVNFDYSDVGDMIDVYVLTMAGLQDNPIPHSTGNPFQIRFKHRGWLSPQNGYVMAWWLKPTPQVAQTENEH